MAKRVLTQDYFELLELKDYLSNGGSFTVASLEKESIGQEILDNRYFHDFNLDGVIDYKDYMIAWSWIIQGKPSDVNNFNAERGGAAWCRSLPYQYVQDDEIEAETITDPETGQITQVFNIVLSIPTADSPAAPYIPPETEPLPPELVGPVDPVDPDPGVDPPVDALTADWDLDGEIDELELRVLERMLLIRPTTLDEYNLNIGDYPPIKVLPNLATMKYSCTNPDMVDWNDLLIFQDWLRQGKTNRLDKFNGNRAEGVPEACRLPIETYEAMGAATQTFDDVYTGIENL